MSRLDMEGRLSDWLPPREMWLANPYDKAQKIETPVDQYGLVDANQHIEQILSKVDPAFKWPKDVLSVHHLYYYSSWYGFPSAGPDAEEFRELPTLKRLLPKVFENFLHLFSWPPDIPHPDVRHEVQKSYAASQGLFTALRIAVQHQRMVRALQQGYHRRGIILPPEFRREDLADRAILLDGLGQHFEVIDRRLSALDEVAPEFRLIEPDRAVLENAERRREFLGTLGKIIMPKAMLLTRPIVSHG